MELVHEIKLLHEIKLYIVLYAGPDQSRKQGTSGPASPQNKDPHKTGFFIIQH